MKRILILTEKFSAGHLYKNDNFSESDNKKYFGKCYTKYGHGHNYRLEVGFVIPEKTSEIGLKKIKTQLQKKLFSLTNHLDHSHLNFDIAEFKKTIPTTENLVLYFEAKIKKLKLKNQLHHLRLYESDDLFSELSYE